MKLIETGKNVAAGAAVGISVVAALPIAGPIGAITAAGATVASIAGGVCGLIDSLDE